MFWSASSGPPAAICPSSGSFGSVTTDSPELLAAGQLERPRLRRVAPQEACPLEVREVRVHGRG